MVSKICFVVNPNSQGGKTGKTWEKKFEQIQDSLGSEFDLNYLLADGIGEGIIQTQNAIKDGYHLIISVGGEGTANEVINGIHNSGKEIKMGFIRGGTVNDYLRTIKWPHQLKAEIEIIAKQKYKATPLLKITGKGGNGVAEKIGLNVADIGVGANIAYMASVERRLTWIRNSLRYQLLSIRALLGWSNVSSTIEINDQMIQGDLSLLTAGYSKYSGSYKLHPHAEPYGEHMAYTLALNFSKWEMLTKMKMLQRGDHTPEMENIYMGKTDQITIRTDDPVLYEIDGEPMEEPASQITIETIPDRLDILIK